MEVEQSLSSDCGDGYNERRHRTVARAFGARRAKVGLVARNVDALAVAAEEIRQVGGDALVLPTDVAARRAGQTFNSVCAPTRHDGYAEPGGARRTGFADAVRAASLE